MDKTKKLLLLLCVSGLILGSCKDNSEKELLGEKTVSTKTENTVEAYVTLHLEGGQTIELNPRRQSGTISSTRLNVNMSDFGLLLMLRLHDNKEAIEEKEYTDPRADIAIKNIAKDGALEEEYRSYYYESKEGKEGDTRMKITSIGENHAEGTFTGTLYSKSNKKATIEGKFNIKKKKK